MTGNLPDDVTPGDIDRRFGAPNRVRIAGTVTVDVVADVPASASPSERRAALREAALDGDDIQPVAAEIEETLEVYK